jgi:hypothetical protein
MPLSIGGERALRKQQRSIFAQARERLHVIEALFSGHIGFHVFRLRASA